ncbi:hypothetical protein PAMP_018781 [Pampus punctatissimus]
MGTRMEVAQLESRMNTEDYKKLQSLFLDTSGESRSLSRTEFIDLACSSVGRGSREEFGLLFDSVVVTQEHRGLLLDSDAVKDEGRVDWGGLCSYLLLELSDKVKITRTSSVPCWKPTRTLTCPHRDPVQKVLYLQSSGQYLTVSKGGTVGLRAGEDMSLLNTHRLQNNTVRPKDLWVTDMVLLHNVHKIAVSFTSKEVYFYDVLSKLDFSCKYKLQGLKFTPWCLDYWVDPSQPDQAVLTIGDIGGQVSALYFTSAQISLFERLSLRTDSDSADIILWDDLVKGKHRSCYTVTHQAHKPAWVRKATAGVDHQVLLWNPYVTSEPLCALSGHTSPVTTIRFMQTKQQLLSYSSDKVLCLWDVSSQLCIHRLEGVFPKTQEDTHTRLFLHEERQLLLLSFNSLLFLLETVKEEKRTNSHEHPVTCVLYNSLFRQNECRHGSRCGDLTGPAAEKEHTGDGLGKSFVEPSEWKGGVQHRGDVLCAAFQPPQTLVTGHFPDSLGFSGKEESENCIAVTRLLFLPGRTSAAAATGGADLVSCGGSGVVRLWNSVYSHLVGQFTAHNRDLGSIVMTVSPCGKYLVTADREGTLKTWDIQQYCLKPKIGVTKEPPTLLHSFRPHLDRVSHLETCIHGDRLLLLSASSDCSVALSYLPGDTIGLFGQEEQWCLETPKCLHPQQEADGQQRAHKGQGDTKQGGERSPSAPSEMYADPHPDTSAEEGGERLEKKECSKMRRADEKKREERISRWREAKDGSLYTPAVHTPCGTFSVKSEENEDIINRRRLFVKTTRGIPERRDMNLNDFVVLPNNKAKSVKLNARNLQELQMKTVTLAQENKEMEEKLQQLKESMSKEKEERGHSGGFRWKSGVSLNSGALTNITKKNKENTLQKLSAGKVKIRLLKDEPLTVFLDTLKDRITVTDQLTSAALLTDIQTHVSTRDVVSCFQKQMNHSCYPSPHSEPINNQAFSSNTITRQGDQNPENGTETPVKHMQFHADPSQVLVGEEKKVEMTEDRQERKDEKGFSTSLLRGEYDEENSARSFQEALRQWRGQRSDGEGELMTQDAMWTPVRQAQDEDLRRYFASLFAVPVSRSRTEPQITTPESCLIIEVLDETDRDINGVFVAEQRTDNNIKVPAVQQASSKGRTPVPQTLLTSDEFSRVSLSPPNRTQPSRAPRQTKAPQKVHPSKPQTSPAEHSIKLQSPISKPSAYPTTETPRTSETSIKTATSKSQKPRCSPTVHKSKPHCGSPQMLSPSLPHSQDEICKSFHSFPPDVSPSANTGSPIPEEHLSPTPSRSFSLRATFTVSPSSSLESILLPKVYQSTPLQKDSPSPLLPEQSQSSKLFPETFSSLKLSQSPPGNLDSPKQSQHFLCDSECLLSDDQLQSPLSPVSFTPHLPPKLLEPSLPQTNLVAPENTPSSSSLLNQSPLDVYSRYRSTIGPTYEDFMSSTPMTCDHESPLSRQDTQCVLSITSHLLNAIPNSPLVGKMEEEEELSVDSGDEMSSDSLGLAPHEEISSDEEPKMHRCLARGRSRDEDQGNSAISHLEDLFDPADEERENDLQSDEPEQLSEPSMVMHNQRAGSGSEHSCDLDEFSPLGLDMNCGHSDKPEHTHCDSHQTSPHDQRGSVGYRPSSTEEHLVFRMMKENQTQRTGIQIHSTTPTRREDITANELGTSGSWSNIFGKSSPTLRTNTSPLPVSVSPSLSHYPSRPLSACLSPTKLGSELGPAFRPLSRAAREIMEICSVDQAGCEDPDLDSETTAHTLKDLEQELRLMAKETGAQSLVVAMGNSGSQAQRENLCFTRGRVSEEQKEDDEAEKSDRQSVLLLR